MRRRRFKPRMQWLPTIGTELDQAVTFDRSPSGRFFSFVGIVTPGTPQLVLSTELTFDQPGELAATNLGSVNPLLLQAATLSTWEMSSWRLRRVVGKLFAGASNSDQQAQGAPALLLTAAIMVRLAEEGGGPSRTIADSGPAQLQNIRDPWLWRRQWVLATSFAGSGTSGVTDALLAFPRTTADYGSVQDGSHIDQKTNRVIGPQERLFLNVEVDALPMPVPTNANAVEVHGYFDYRLLGSIMKSTNRRNASR